MSNDDRLTFLSFVLSLVQSENKRCECDCYPHTSLPSFIHILSLLFIIVSLCLSCQSYSYIFDVVSFKVDVSNRSVFDEWRSKTVWLKHICCIQACLMFSLFFFVRSFVRSYIFHSLDDWAVSTTPKRYSIIFIYSCLLSLSLSLSRKLCSLVKHQKHRVCNANWPFVTWFKFNSIN